MTTGTATRAKLTCLTVVLTVALPVLGQHVMQTVVAPGEATITVSENGRPALVYNFHTVPVPDGVSGKYAVARSNYVHPLFGLDGDVLTTDYSPDHPHHRGIYWAWPEVTYAGKTHDLHALQGVFARPVRIVQTGSGPDAAAFTVENEWRWEDREPIVRELATVRVARTAEHGRVIDFDLRFEALKSGVTLARRGKTHYGGLNIRMSPRQDQQIVKVIDPPDAFPRRAWAALTGVPSEGREPASLSILQAWDNPDYPGDWVDYPKLNWLQPTFPASGTTHPLQLGTPLRLRYRLCVSRNAPTPDTAIALWDTYNALQNGRMTPLAAYRFGDSRTRLAAIEKRVLASRGQEREDLERDLIQLLELPAATADIRDWACRQLAVLGSARAVPALRKVLLDSEQWPMACYALRSTPAPEAATALRKALASLPSERRLAVLSALGERRDAAAVATVVAQLQHEMPGIRTAAVETLARIGTPAAAAALGRVEANTVPAATLYRAQLQCADLLRSAGQHSMAAAVFRAVWKSTAPTAQRAAALLGLVSCREPDALQIALAALEHDSARLRHAAVAALPALRSDESARALTEALEAAAPRLRLAIIPILAEWEARDAQATIAGLLKAEDGAVQVAALKALIRIGGHTYLQQIAEFAAQRGNLGKLATAGLVQIRGDQVATQLRRLAQNGPPDIRPVAIDAMASRNAPGTAAALLSLATDPDAKCATRALTGLKRVADVSHLPKMLQLYTTVPDPVRNAAGSAVLGVILQTRTPPNHTPALLAAVKATTPEVQAHALGLLASIGGETALAAAQGALESDAATQRAAAVRALATWRDAEALPAIRDAFEHATDARERALLLRGAVRLIPISTGTSQEKAQALAALAARQLTVPEQKLLIAALAGIRTAATLPLLTGYLANPETAAEAALAVHQAVLPADGRPGLVGTDAKTALKQTIPLLTDEAKQQEAKAYLAEIASSNLARGRPASSNKPAEGGHPPAHAVDGVITPRSYWGCAESPPARLQVDLQDAFVIDAVHLYTYWGGKRYYQYFIELSEDAETWTEVADQRANVAPATAQGVRFEFEPVKARFVRVSMLRNSANPGLHIVELKVFEAVE